jgi:hypothetical protein
MKIKIFFHNNCFDGVASAAVFGAFYRECINPESQQIYEGLAHKAGQMFEEASFDGDENAIVDFKYCSSPRLTWWFDHHQSAFLNSSDEAHFYQDIAGLQTGKKFHSVDFRSCTKFIAAITSQKYGFDTTKLHDLIEWADIIDGALYQDAQTAVELNAPAMRLMLVIESVRNDELLHQIIRDMQTHSLENIVKQPYIADIIGYYYNRHWQALDVIKRQAQFERGVIYFDVSEQDMEGYSKFIPYYLYPDALYNVGVSVSTFRAKVSVGFNPWATQARRHNLASICERYGGGGHPVVGAISFPPQNVTEARKVALEIATELRES